MLFVILAILFIILVEPMENCNNDLNTSKKLPLCSKDLNLTDENESIDEDHCINRSKTIDAIIFSILALTLVVLNAGPNVCIYIMSVDTRPSIQHQGLYFGVISSIGKFGACK